MTPLILASSSPYRRQILQKIGLPFSQSSPDVDESRIPGEAADHYVSRLALKKALAIAENTDHGLVIGSDQCAVLDGQILGKPGNHENAVRQLSLASGKTVTFYTGLCLYNAKTHDYSRDCISTKVSFRTLSAAMIEHYLKIETPYDCAGSFKSEGFGVTLFERIEGGDPDALVGLPLIRLVQMLTEHDLDPLVHGFKLPPDGYQE